MDSGIRQSWFFESSSSKKKSVYETLLYNDGTTSCNCMGWTRRIDWYGERECKHTRMVKGGIADSYCVKTTQTTATITISKETITSYAKTTRAFSFNE